VSAPLPATSVQPAAWLNDALVGFASSVISIVPSGYPAYARLLHPATQQSDDMPTRIPWQIVADHIGLTIDKNSQWDNLAALLPSEVLQSYEPPLEGTLEPQTYEELVTILKSHTSTPDLCWYGVWEGYDYLLKEFQNAPVFHLNGRSYYLFEDALTLPAISFSGAPFLQSANIFWPDDRAWCVATEIDLCSTYIAASEETIDDLLGRLTGEVYQVALEDRITLI
jgi:hypothetical protein